MWQFHQPGPSTFVRSEVIEPDDTQLVAGEVLLRFCAGGICGSDIPKYLGNFDSDNDDTGRPGAPLHEIVGTVEASRDDSLEQGQRVVGIVRGSRGLSEIIRNPAQMLFPVDSRLDDVTATMIQPLATVLSTFSHANRIKGARVAILGLGPLGLLFTHVAQSLGASQVVGVDRVDRSDMADAFGIDELVHDHVRVWSERIESDHNFDIVVDAIGHRQEHVSDAVRILRDGGQLILFGLPEDHYVFPMRQFFRKNLTLFAGTTRDWQKYLCEAQEYLIARPEVPRSYITNVESVDRVEDAFRTYTHPSKGRLKIVLTPPEMAQR